MSLGYGRQSSSPDGPSEVLVGIFTVAIVFALTPSGLLSAAIPLALLRFTGRVSVPITMAALAAGALIARLYLFGITETTEALVAVFHLLVRSPESGLYAWTRLSLLWSVWSVTIPAGLMTGACVALSLEAAKLSPLIALSKGQTLRPAPRTLLAKILHRRVERGAACARSGVTILGTEWRAGQTVVVSDADLTRHMLVAGTTGSGKTTTILNLVEGCQTGLVIIDGKGDADLAKRVISMARERGQKALLLDGTGTLASDIYNPLASGDFTALADRIITLREWSEPHYARLAQRYAQTAFKVLKICESQIDLLSAAHAMQIDYLLATVKDGAKRGIVSRDHASKLLREVADLRGIERHIDGLRSEIAVLAGSVLGELFETHRASGTCALIDLAQARQEGALVYFCLPALKYPAFARTLGALVINDLKYVVASSHKPWRVMCDEFSVFAGPQVLNLLNQGRGYSLSVVLATQSLADIAQGSDQDKDKFLDQMIGSINCYVIHRLNSSADRELIATVLGTDEAVEYTVQTVGGAATGAASARHTKQFIVHPDAIAGLDTGEAYFINKNSRAASKITTRRSRK